MSALFSQSAHRSLRFGVPTLHWCDAAFWQVNSVASQSRASCGPSAGHPRTSEPAPRRPGGIAASSWGVVVLCAGGLVLGSRRAGWDWRSAGGRGGAGSGVCLRALPTTPPRHTTRPHPSLEAPLGHRHPHPPRPPNHPHRPHLTGVCGGGAQLEGHPRRTGGFDKTAVVGPALRYRTRHPHRLGVAGLYGSGHVQRQVRRLSTLIERAKASGLSRKMPFCRW